MLKKNHPYSLYVFAATEIWERYGFYAVQSLLALYLSLHFKLDDQHVYALVGSFTALTYLSPIIGGFIADHLLGQKRSIAMGILFLFCSYVALFLLSSEFTLTIALACIAVGTGLLKPNISALLGNQYKSNLANRDSGFTIFYIGITLGIILGTTLPSKLNYYLGWSSVFASAAVGLILAAIVFGYGIFKFDIQDFVEIEFDRTKLIKAIGIILLSWLSFFCILSIPGLSDVAFISVGLLCVYYIIRSSRQETGMQSKQTLVIGLLCLISIMFWSFYFQMFMSLTLFISRVAEDNLFGIMFPPPYYITIQSLGMVLFGYFISSNVSKITLAQSGVRAGNKFVISMGCMSAAYFVITIICHYSNPAAMISPLYFFIAYLLISVAELLLSPIGLSAITILASKDKASTMMGVFFVSLGIGAYLSGRLAQLTAIANPESMNLIETKLHYAHIFTEQLYLLIFVTVLCVGFNKLIKVLLK